MIHILKAQNARRASNKKKRGEGGVGEWGEPTSAFHLTDNQPRKNITVGGKIWNPPALTNQHPKKPSSTKSSRRNSFPENQQKTSITSSNPTQQSTEATVVDKPNENYNNNNISSINRNNNDSPKHNNRSIDNSNDDIHEQLLATAGQMAVMNDNYETIRKRIERFTEHIEKQVATSTDISHDLTSTDELEIKENRGYEIDRIQNHTEEHACDYCVLDCDHVCLHPMS